MVLEVFYDGAAEPSVSVPCLDFFGLPHGRPVAYHSALTAVNEGRGFNSYVPMPFRRRDAHRVRQRLGRGPRRSTTRSTTRCSRSSTPTLGYLHVAFRRENPTVQRRDIVITDGLRGPGRFLGCVVGVRVIDQGDVVRRGRGEGVPRRRRRPAHDLRHRPRGLRRQRLGDGRARHAVRRRTAGRRPGGGSGPLAGQPEFVGFYRWHLPDPIMFTQRPAGHHPADRRRRSSPGRRRSWPPTSSTNPPAGAGWMRDLGAGAPRLGHRRAGRRLLRHLVRLLRRAPAGARVDLAAAVADIGRRDYEVASPFEVLGALGGTAGPTRPTAAVVGSASRSGGMTMGPQAVDFMDPANKGFVLTTLQGEMDDTFAVIADPARWEALDRLHGLGGAGRHRAPGRRHRGLLPQLRDRPQRRHAGRAARAGRHGGAGRRARAGVPQRVARRDDRPSAGGLGAGDGRTSPS